MHSIFVHNGEHRQHDFKLMIPILIFLEMLQKKANIKFKLFELYCSSSCIIVSIGGHLLVHWNHNCSQCRLISKGRKLRTWRGRTKSCMYQPVQQFNIPLTKEIPRILQRRTSLDELLDVWYMAVVWKVVLVCVSNNLYDPIVCHGL